MLTAIQDFARDAFNWQEEETLSRIQYMENEIYLDAMPHSILALVAKGIPPSKFYPIFQDFHETIHTRSSKLLRDFKGDVTPFNQINGLLEQHLYSSLIYPLKLEPQNIRIKSDEKAMINRTLEIMKEKDTDYFYVSFLLAKKKGFQVRDAETILNLIHKRIFQPIL